MNNRTDDEKLFALLEEEALAGLTATEAEQEEFLALIGKSKEELVSDAKSIVQAAVENGGKKRLTAAKTSLKGDTLPDNVVEWPKERKLELFKEVDGIAELTMAARNRQVYTDDEIDQQLEDLIDLGVIDEKGNVIE